MSALRAGRFKLYCYILERSESSFHVDIAEGATVSELKEEILIKNKNTLVGVDGHQLKIWKNYMSTRDLKTQLANLQLYDENALDGAVLLSSQFSDASLGQIHVIAEAPHANQSVPPVSPFWSPRCDTVHQLYEILLREKLVHVRGTPGCGKTTLKTLLHAHIRNQMPSAFVATQHSWDPTKSESELEVQQRLRKADPAFPRQSITFLLFDEGQDTYSDSMLWNSFIKEAGIGIFPYYRVILFCSYGSPTSHPLDYDIGSPPGLRAAARISLWPVEGAPGILLQWSEFLEVVSRSERPLNLRADLLSLIFDWTVGHVGAVVELLHLISYLKVSKTHRGEPFTVQDFHDENPVHLLVQRLQGGAFERGLPREFSPDFVALFRTLLKDRKFDKQDGEAQDGAVLKCHRRGWIYATMIQGGVRYTLPSPLHEVCLSWKLEPTNDIPRFASLFELSLEVISKFKPSQLQLPPRRVGSTSTNPPEAQYQDEFYRALLATTFGNVCISPEYASAQGARVVGRIDFFIPIVKWGIEITRDGSQILEHGARFEDSGAYRAWLFSADMNDYILLDFRTKNLRGQHPKIPNLFHVTFRNEYQEFFVYDNRLKIVKGPIALQENH